MSEKEVIVHIRTLYPDDVRKIVQEELLKWQQTDILITHKEAIAMFKQHNLPAHKHGYVSLKKMIAQGIIQQKGSRVRFNSVQNYIQSQINQKKIKHEI
jgi:hypothetical protein